MLSRDEVKKHSAALSSLQELGVIVCCDDASVEPSVASKWQLSETASSHMIDCVTLCEPSSALDPRPGLELVDCNTHELMIRLTSEGFQFVLTSEGPKSLQQKEPYCPHDSNGKTVYVHPYKDIPHSYFLALLRATGPVQHGLSATEYAKLCGMKYKKSATKTSETLEFEFQTSAVVKDPKPVRAGPAGRDKARQKVAQGKQKRVMIKPVDVSMNPQSFKRAPATRRNVSKPTGRFRLMRKTKVTTPMARTTAKRTGSFLLIRNIESTSSRPGNTLKHRLHLKLQQDKNECWLCICILWIVWGSSTASSTSSSEFWSEGSQTQGQFCTG